MKFQKGQSIVEFAIILPFLVLFLIGLMYFGLMFSNYVALNDIARDAARSAAMMSDADYKAASPGDRYASIRQNYATTSLPNGTYHLNTTDPDKFAIKYNSDRSVTVKLTADLDESEGSLAGPFFNVVGGATLRNLSVSYNMYSEVEHIADEE